MYFTWKNNSYGFIKISETGFRNFLNKLLNPVLNPHFIIHSLSLEPNSENDTAKLILALHLHGTRENDSLKNIAQSKVRSKIENYLSMIFRPMGIIISVVWVEPEKNFFELIINPWVWGFSAASLSIIFSSPSGAENLFWSAFWGVSAWFAAKILSNLNLIINQHELN